MWGRTVASVGARRNKSGEVVFRVQFRIGNSAKQETFPTEKAADKFKELVDRIGGEAAREILERRRNNTGNTPTLREWTERYLDDTSGILTGIQPGTRGGYRHIAETGFLPMLGDYPMDSISKADVGRWLAWQEKQPSKRGKGQPMAAKTIRNYHALLSNILKSAYEHGVIPANPARSIRLSEGTSREGVFLSVTEYAAILEEIPEFYRPLVAFLAGTGARWSEATAVTEGDVSRDHSPVLVRLNKAWKKPGGSTGHVVGPTKTKAGIRSVSLWPEVVALLPRRDNPDELLFQGRSNNGRVWYGSFNTRIWRPAVERSGVNKAVNIHDLRHTHASWLIASGASLLLIQRRMGHAKIETTIGVYGHLMPTAQQEVADIMQHLFADMGAMGGRVLGVIEASMEDEEES